MMMEKENFRKLSNDLPEKAVEVLYDYLYHKLVSFSFRRLQNHEEAKDIVQEAFAYICQKPETLTREDVHIELYLAGIVRNKSITRVRQFNRTRTLNVMHVNTLAFEQELQDEMLDVKAKRKLIWKIICEFPLREQQCLKLKFYANMSGAEIAQALNISGKSVERGLASGYKRFRKLRHCIY
jgi:RNA polymerase sigma factor (sigma-70 family)